jgi:hypothetical protein
MNKPLTLRRLKVPPWIAITNFERELLEELGVIADRRRCEMALRLHRSGVVRPLIRVACGLDPEPIVLTKKMRSHKARA